MLNPPGHIPSHTDREADRLPLPELWSDVLSDALPAQVFCLEWLFDTAEQKQRLAR